MPTPPTTTRRSRTSSSPSSNRTTDRRPGPPTGPGRSAFGGRVLAERAGGVGPRAVGWHGGSVPGRYLARWVGPIPSPGLQSVSCAHPCRSPRGHGEAGARPLAARPGGIGSRNLVHRLRLVVALGCGVDRFLLWTRTHIRPSHPARNRTGWPPWPWSPTSWPPRTWTGSRMWWWPSGSCGCGGWWIVWKASGSRNWPPSTAAAPPVPNKDSRSARRLAGCGTGCVWGTGRPAGRSGRPGPCSGDR